MPKADKIFKILKLAVLCLLLALLTTALSSCVIWVESPKELDNMEFGRPFAYLVQNYRGTIREEYFPRPVHPQLSAENCETTFFPAKFVLSYAVHLGVFAAAVFGIAYLVPYFKKKKAARRDGENL